MLRNIVKECGMTIMCPRCFHCEELYISISFSEKEGVKVDPVVSKTASCNKCGFSKTDDFIIIDSDLVCVVQPLFAKGYLLSKYAIEPARIFGRVTRFVFEESAILDILDQFPIPYGWNSYITNDPNSGESILTIETESWGDSGPRIPGLEFPDLGLNARLCELANWAHKLPDVTTFKNTHRP